MADSTPLAGVMFIGAHPDDETIMVGGALALLARRGVPTHVVCATDGRGGEGGGIAEAATPAGRAAVRLDELRCACDALGVSRLHLLGYEDPIMVETGDDVELFGFEADEAELVEQIAALVRATGVEVLVTHGTDGEYGHPAHKQVHAAVRRAVRDHLPDRRLYTVAAYVPGLDDRLLNASDPAHLVLDITPWVEAKHDAMLCHRTQHALFMRRRKLRTVREALRYTETFRRQWPEWPEWPEWPDSDHAPDDPFAALLIAAGATRPAPPDAGPA